MFEPLYTAEEMRRAEEGHDVAQLMDRAGKAVADHILADYPGAQRITIVCGGGNNGGDGRVAGQYLEQARLEVRIVDAKAAETDLGSHEVLVDALFGTGFSGEPRPDAARLIEGMNASDAVVVAVDLPSGVDASTGEVAGAAVEATSTVTFHGAKVGHYVGPGTFLHGFCVGSPWNSLAVDSNVGRIVAFGVEIVRQAPEKILALPKTMTEQDPETVSRLIRGLRAAAHGNHNRVQSARLLQHFQTHRGRAHDDANVVRRMRDGTPLLFGDAVHRLDGLVIIATFLDDRRSPTPHRRRFLGIVSHRHADGRVDAEQRRRVGNSLSVIAGRGRDDAPGTLLR